MTLNLRDKQLANVRAMLNLNNNSSYGKSKENRSLGDGGGEPVWKILVYDRVGQDILTTLLSVQELRTSGVTLHVLLHSERENIPDVPAVYFCAPSEDNIDRIGRDLQSMLYDIYYLNFVTPIPRSRIEDLASAAWQSNSATAIQKVYDQYSNFICLESDFFVLKHQDANSINFYALNRGSVSDTEMEAMLDNIVESLFSVATTLGVVPIIRSPRGNAAEQIAEKLDKKIRDNLKDPRTSLFNSANDSMSSAMYTFQRPLLLIFDRGVDLVTPLHHTWTYQALSHDVLDLNLNQIKYSDQDSSPSVQGSSNSPRQLQSRSKSYDFDERRDFFWSTYRGSPFPTTAEAIQSELEEYRKSEDEVKRLKTTMGLDGVMPSDLTEIGSDMLNDNTAKLTSAITNLPQLLEKKRILDAHTSIATAILKEIKDRKLDTFFELESKLINRMALERSVLDILLDSDMGTPEDKMRFFLIYYLTMGGAGGHKMSQSELDGFNSALESAGCDLSPITFAKKWMSYSKMSSSMSSGLSYSTGSSKSSTSSMFSKFVTTGSSFLMEGVRNLVVKRQNLPLTRVVEEVMDGRSPSDPSEELRYFDPKLLKPATGPPTTKGTNSFTDAIVFVVGGGNYIEYQNLQDFCKSRSSASSAVTRRITYGSTTLTNASQFLKQLSSLGAEMK